jgi:hypothetical protein
VSGAEIFGVFRVKNHDFTQKNQTFFDCGRRRENFWGISGEKSPKNHIFSNCGPKNFGASVRNRKKYDFLAYNRDFLHEIPQKFSRLRPQLEKI